MKNSKFNSLAILATTSLILLSGCSKSGKSDNQAANQPSTDKPSLSAALSPQGVKAAAIAALPQANPNTPLDQYTPLTSGNQLMFLYYGLSSMPVDYEKIAQKYSQEYRSTSDVFKQKDILNALKPRIDAEIAQAKNNRYFMMRGDANLSNYDFNAEDFPNNDALLSSGGYGYFYDNNGYHYSFTNGADFKMLKVADEAKARQIEGMVNKYPSMKIVYYAYAQDIDPNSMTVKAQIVKVKLLDASGNELYAQ